MDQLRSVNLNLLVSLHALLAEGSVAGAAQRVGVTPSAMSHTLRQLRELFDDPLLVRAGQRMVPTPRAEALGKDLDRALGLLEGVVAHRSAFDPARFTGRLTLATQDGVIAALAPALFPRFRAEAPHAELTIVRPPDDLVQALQDGRVDVASAPPVDVPAGLVQEPITGSEPGWAVICCADHPVTELDLDAFCTLPHAMMSLSGRGPSFVDHALARLGRQRQVAVRVPYLLALPYVLPGTDLIAVTVDAAADTLAASWPLKRLEVPAPVELPRAPIVLLWHARYEAEPAHQWFRGLLAAAGRAAQLHSQAASCSGSSASWSVTRATR